MVLERIVALPPRDILTEALVRLHGPGWRVTSLGENHVELTSRPRGHAWPFIVFPLAAFAGHVAVLYASIGDAGTLNGERLLRYGLLVWPGVIVGLVAYHFARRAPASITITALAGDEGTRLVARAEGGPAAQEDLAYFLDHIISLARARLFPEGSDMPDIELG